MENHLENDKDLNERKNGLSKAKKYTRPDTPRCYKIWGKTFNDMPMFKFLSIANYFWGHPLVTCAISVAVERCLEIILFPNASLYWGQKSVTLTIQAVLSLMYRRFIMKWSINGTSLVMWALILFRQTLKFGQYVEHHIFSSHKQMSRFGYIDTRLFKLVRDVTSLSVLKNLAVEKNRDVERLEM